MKHAIVVCEGQTEQVFVRNILVPALAAQEVFVEPRVIKTSQRGRGGALSGQRVLRFLRNTLRERRDAYVTTFFDLYGLPGDFPGRSGGGAQMDPVKRAAAIENGFHAAVVREAECRPERFFPHIQPYEFEALLFSDVKRFPETDPQWTTCLPQLQKARDAAQTPEHINDGLNTHPSARLRQLLRPRYDKVLHGSAVSARIGIGRMRAECRHFDKWLSRVESLPRRQAE